ncbi:hypothetical protein BB561_000212 [Smittium simulii]|uniref:Metal homeostatis protein BSD2 n=1 Tax=Smittium simulii TaxID=133385 RepID=A0A2T9Z066_9FUNG|nr:hypothetical protein BB561_000212 [Smittium simulii]
MPNEPKYSKIDNVPEKKDSEETANKNSEHQKSLLFDAQASSSGQTILSDSDSDSETEQNHDPLPAIMQIFGDSSNSNTSAVQSSKAHSAIPVTNDGVFSNMSAKPTLDNYLDIVEKAPDEPLPTYLDIYGPSSTAAPSYFEPAIVSVGNSDELLVEGLPVGSFFVFLVNFMISYAFQIVGFMMTFLLHTSHASKNGSIAGFGATLISFGFYVQSSINSTTGPVPLPNPSETNPSMPGSPDGLDFDSPGNNLYVSFFLMVTGWCLIIKSVASYFQSRRMEQIILSNPYQS